jgi:glycosyltransferase involved in cell wall biosynthesis
MKKQLTLTIGIPAYNEALNLPLLLANIKSQKLQDVVIKDIFIVSDGSTDDTIAVVRKQKEKRVRLFVEKTRKGIAHGINTIFSHSTTDAVVLLNADIVITDSRFLQKLTKPLQSQKADLVSCPIVELDAETFLEEVLRISMQMKRLLFGMIHDGDNVFTCFGPARAFSKRLYTQLRVPTSVGEDAYSYFFAKRHNYVYAHTRATAVTYRLPQTMRDHLNQSTRFQKSIQRMKRLFGEQMVTDAYTIPVHHVLAAVAVSFYRHPLYVSAYIIILIYAKVYSVFAVHTKDVWDIAKSSKTLVRAHRI